MEPITQYLFPVSVGVTRDYRSIAHAPGGMQYSGIAAVPDMNFVAMFISG